MKIISILKIKGEYRLKELRKQPQLFSKKHNLNKSYKSSKSSRQPIIINKNEYEKLDKSNIKVSKNNPNGFEYNGYFISVLKYGVLTLEKLYLKQINKKEYREEVTKEGKKVQKVIKDFVVQ